MLSNVKNIVGRTLMPLWMAETNERTIVRKITGKDAVRQRLAELGLVVGAEVRVVSRQGDTMILAVMDSRVALNRSMTARILV